MTSIDIEGLKAEVERVDDIPLLYGLLTQMGIQTTVDNAVKPNGNWQGLSLGWTITLWLVYILSEQDHRMRNVSIILDSEIKQLL